MTRNPFPWILILGSLWTGCHGSGTRPDVNTLVKANQELALREVMTPPAPPVIDDLVIFGDSLSDSGRLHRRSMGLYIPSDVYWQGRITNGPNWADYVCGTLGCRMENHAVAGASTRLDDFFLRLVLRPLDTQVQEFLDDELSTLKGSTLAVIWIGANNYLKTMDMRPDEVRADIKAAATRVLNTPVQRLLIGTMPQLAGILKSPKSQDTVPHSMYRDITAVHNRNIHALIAELQQEFPAKSIALFDAYEINQETMDRPADFGFTSIKDACYQGDYLGEFHVTPGFCPEPSSWKFWDYTHPNSRMHCYYAARFLLSMHEAGWLETVDAQKLIDRCRQI